MTREQEIEFFNYRIKLGIELVNDTPVKKGRFTGNDKRWIDAYSYEKTKQVMSKKFICPKVYLKET